MDFGDDGLQCLRQGGMDPQGSPYILGGLGSI